MKTITVLSDKGGVGKTFAAVVLAQLFQIAGKRVAVVDTDTQLNAVDLLRRMDGAPVFQRVEVFASPAKLPDLGKLERLGFDLAIIDTPPEIVANKVLKPVLEKTDLFIVPLVLNRHSLFAVENTLALLPAGRPVLPVCSVNASTAKTKDKAMLLELVKDKLGQRDGDVRAVVFLPYFQRVESNLSARRDFFVRLTEKEYEHFEKFYEAARRALAGK